MAGRSPHVVSIDDLRTGRTGARPGRPVPIQRGAALATEGGVTSSRGMSRRILLGLTAGTLAGVFLGEEARMFAAVADGFVKLLQMAVLPYVTVSIVAGIGSLDLHLLRRLGARTALVLPALWAVSLAFAFLMPLVFPPSPGAAFFSTTLLEQPASFNLVDLYIPANPFFALANGVVPAVVLFS